MPSSVRVSVTNRQRKLKVDSAGLRRLAKRVLCDEGLATPAEVELVFLRDEPMAALNEQYRGRQGATDVLSFLYGGEDLPDEETGCLGSVVISVDRAAKQAAERGHEVAQEIARLVTHGLLHLMGYQDEEAADRRRMRARENFHLEITRTGGR